MLTEDGFAFFHRILFLVTKLRLHPLVVRNGLLFNAESKRTQLVGWASVVLNSLYLPLLIGRITIAGKIEGIIHSYVILCLVGGITLKMTILLYHSELIQVVNNVVQLHRKLGKSNIVLSICFH